MAALTYFVSHTLSDLWSLANALLSNGGNFHQAVHQLRVRERDQRFQRYCRELWYHSSEAELSAAKQQNRTSSARPIRRGGSAKQSKCNMNRAAGGIDFAAIEASAEAFEVIDDFSASERRRKQQMNDFLCNERQHHLEPLPNIEDVEVIDGVEIESSFYEYFDALPLYEDRNIEPLHEGVSYTITGYVLPDCERFSINFLLPEGDMALHINPRLPQNYIVRNSKVRDTWGREEVSSPLPFTLRRGAKFAIQVLVTKDCYMISVNGHHFAEYAHRLPYRDISIIQVKGDIEQVVVERQLVNEYPERLPNTRPRQIDFEAPPQLRKAVIAVIGATTGVASGSNKSISLSGSGDDEDVLDGENVPKSFRIVRTKSIFVKDPMSLQPTPECGYPMPFYGTLLRGALYTGRCLKVEGRVKLLPHSFYINLQQGQNIWPHALIAFHFNPRFAKQSGTLGKAVVCRNAWFNGKWAEEERSELDTDLRPGKMFSLAIVCVADAFEVYVNRKYITEYKYRLQPDVIDMVYIQGDIKLWKVVLGENTLLDGGKKRIYQNPTYVENL